MPQPFYDANRDLPAELKSRGPGTDVCVCVHVNLRCHRVSKFRWKHEIKGCLCRITLRNPDSHRQTIFPAYVSALFVFVALSLAPRPTDVSHRRLKKKNLVQKQPNHFADRQSQTYSLASSCAAQTFENRVCNLWLFFFFFFSVVSSIHYGGIKNIMCGII